MTLFALFQGWPIIVSWYYAMSDWSGLSSQIEFIGLANFRELIQDRYFWNAFKNVFLYTLAACPCSSLSAHRFAVILNNPHLKYANLYRTMIFLPVVTSAAIIGIIMGFIWETEGS